MQDREYGEISTYNGSYAFIRRDADEKDLFAHMSQLKYDPVYRGDKVSFEVAPDMTKPGKFMAQDVRFEGEEKAPK
jgi:cold shock CspA family protein